MCPHHVSQLHAGFARCRNNSDFNQFKIRQGLSWLNVMHDSDLTPPADRRAGYARVARYLARRIVRYAQAMAPRILNLYYTHPITNRLTDRMFHRLALLLPQQPHSALLPQNVVWILWSRLPIIFTLTSVSHSATLNCLCQSCQQYKRCHCGDTNQFVAHSTIWRGRSRSRTAVSGTTRPRTDMPARCTVSGSPESSGCHHGRSSPSYSRR